MVDEALPREAAVHPARRGRPFYILALSLKNIRLIAATRHQRRGAGDSGRAPAASTEALGDLTRQYSQFQAGTSSKTVSRSPIFHGHGTGEDDLKAEIVQFFNLADKALLKHMDRDAPGGARRGRVPAAALQGDHGASRTSWTRG